MDNLNSPEQADLSWLTTWSNFLNQAPFTEQSQVPEATSYLQQLIEASLQGDSCIDVSSEQIAALGQLAISADQATLKVAPCVYDEQGLALYRYWHLEQRLAEQICRLKQQLIQPVSCDDYLDLLTDPHQQAALQMVARQSLSIITGGPGTGKTYTLARIIAVLSQAIPHIRVAMAAPTGKAAQRMQEALQNSFNDPKLLESGLVSEELRNQGTQTIHRLLGMGHSQTPRFNQKQPLPYDVIVVDEASMLDLNLATLLFEAVPESCRIILLGDANQLASVDVGAVLADLQQIQALADNRVQLQTSRRFAEGALIGQVAKFIQAQTYQQDHAAVLQQFEIDIVEVSELKPIVLQSDMPDVVQLEYLPEGNLLDLDTYYQKLMLGFQGYVQSLKNYLKEERSIEQVQNVVKAFDDYRILTAVRHGPFGLQQLNQYAQRWLQQQLSIVTAGGWYVGRPVMMTYNDYQLGISNGDIGLCFEHRTQPQQFEVYFPSLNKWVAANRLPKSIQSAFALTIHKSQGSEFTHTAVVLDQTAKNLLSQELIYTAITRAKKVVSLLVHQEALLQAFTVRTTRKSGLVQKVNRLVR
ncbi:RecBCD enzyme subunit RecD [Acinetobacter sp. BEC1-S18-ESBL-01]|uniref:exodeoxyribonuclease V subunit alpha n=1 Tax=Acinetobacter TaxID=469 RepID=UPI0002CF2030|nr:MULTISPECIES: exodeoxyribonuclease V subunit alpha [Acinetobacter]AMO41943.1 exodeoxyribonuclease V subunit alpha [Acinetobacter sp. DUT-2]ENW14158.1 exodeoxyribonuclease V, alpha subunit [Acinetobacter pittii ANC 3678]EXH35209.1 exodeoxyribonuclease V, alpha subunit [Acinetobacter sp. 1245249]EYT25699.1 exodeoxyribonuclease V, alpha subunit [Acinetobacter sp. 1564232]MCU4469907.1 exodeoxyribonuclease V subunit alpha [Acinetobacter pittii]